MSFLSDTVLAGFAIVSEISARNFLFVATGGRCISREYVLPMNHVQSLAREDLAHFRTHQRTRCWRSHEKESRLWALAPASTGKARSKLWCVTEASHQRKARLICSKLSLVRVLVRRYLHVPA
jgi:hypothetical protein